MKRKTINAVEGIEMPMSSEVEIQTNELAITVHEKGSSVHTILVWGTIDCINEIRDYLSENCENATFVDKGKVSEAKYISHNIPNIESVAVMFIHPSGKTSMSIAPSVKEFIDFMADISDAANYVF